MEKIDNKKDLDSTSGGAHWSFAHRWRDDDHLYRLDQEGVMTLLKNGYTIKPHSTAWLFATTAPGMRVDMPIYSITDAEGNTVTSDTLREVLGEAE